MNRRGKKFISFAAVSVFTLVLYISCYNSYSPSHFSSATDDDVEIEDVALTNQRGDPKITIIVPWLARGNGPPPRYVPYFFNSVEANPQVDLLYVHITDSQDDCTPLWDAPNIKELCLSDHDYYELHADYLCERWGCTTEEKEYLLEHIIKQGAVDGNKTFFRLFRNGVFKRWMDPDTTIWGWCDVDTFWGNFDSVFPWDVAHDFDVIAFHGQPEQAEERLLFTRGHMAFLANTPEMIDKLFTYKKFKNLRSFLSASSFLLDAEESEFSHFLFAENTNITFLQMEGMVNNFEAAFFSEAGTFYSPVPSYAMTPEIHERLVPLITTRRSHRATFSSEGVESETQLYPGSEYNSGLWFDSQYAQFVKPSWNEQQRKEKTYFMRRKPGGPVTHRWEPRERFLSRDGEIIVDECLYKHFQEEKRKPWFKQLPAGGLKRGQVMYQIDDREMQIWDKKGNVVFKTEAEKSR